MKVVSHDSSNNAVEVHVVQHVFSDVEPSSPDDGDVWTDTTSGITYTRYDGVWVEFGPSFTPVTPPGPEPGDGTPFAAAWQADLTNDDFTVTRGSSGSGDYGHGWSGVLEDNSYFEIETDATNGEVDVGVWLVDTVTPQVWWNNQDFSYHGGSSLKVTLGSPWSLNYYGDSSYIAGPTPDTADAPIYRLGVAVTLGSGAVNVWARQVTTSGPEAWLGGGDPALGTTPTFVLTTASGLNDPRIAASMDATTESCTIITPDNHNATAPAGFTPV